MPNFAKSKGFQLRSGNKANAPFKIMGSSPAKQMTISSGNPEDLTEKVVEGPKNEVKKIGPKKPTPEQQQGIKVKGRDDVLTKNIEDISQKGDEEIRAKMAPKEEAEKDEKTKKKLFGNKEVEAEFADLAEMLDPTGRKKGLAAGIREGMQKQATIKKSEVFAADAETRAQEMHDSTLARNESLTKRTNQLAANESAQGNNTIDPTSEFAVVPGEEGETEANMEGQA